MKPITDLTKRRKVRTPYQIKIEMQRVTEIQSAAARAMGDLNQIWANCDAARRAYQKFLDEAAEGDSGAS